MASNLLDNNIPKHLKSEITKLRLIGLPAICIPAIIFYLVWPPSSLRGHIIFWVIYGSIITAYSVVCIRANDWHFSKIKYTEEGVHLYRDTVKYLPKHRFIPWEKILGFTLGKNAAILTINYNPYYLFGEAKEKTPYYFIKYGIKRNPKIREFIGNKYPFLFEKYRDLMEEEK